MRSGRMNWLAGMAIAVLSLPAFGQAPVRTTRATRVNPAQQQKPFTAEFKITTVRTLATGATITRERTEVQAVDSQGRRMTATTEIDPSGEERTATNVFDAVAGTHTFWDTQRHEAFVSSMRPGGSSSIACAAATAKLAPQANRRTSSTEDLGPETIDGLEVRGVRTTITTPA